MRIAVVGVGAVGGYFGGRLAESGEDVWFLARGATLEALKDGGLRVDSTAGDFAVHPVQTTDDPAAVGQVEYVVLGVKAWQVSEAASSLGPLIGEETLVIPLQNGVEAPEQLRRSLGPKHAGGGLCTIIAMRAGPGHIRHVGGTPHIEIGELDNSRSRRIELLGDAIRSAGVSVAIPSDIHVALWRKFSMITAFAGVGATTRAPIGVIRSLPETHALLDGAIAEIASVARARGVRLSDEDIAAANEILDKFEPPSTSSMQRDIAEGRPSELEHLTGAVVRLGREAGVETPVNLWIYRALLPSELRARGELEWPEE